IGGFIADRYWGNRRSILTGGLLMALGQFTLFTAASNYGAAATHPLSHQLLYLGLGFMILGNGFFKPNISSMVGTLYSDTDKRTPALKLFAEVVGKPTFPADALVRIKNQLLASFEFQKQNPAKLASNELFTQLYGSHPYAHPSEGDAKSLPGLSIEQLRAFHKRAYAAGNAVIAIVGDLSRGEAEQIAAQVSSALPKGPALAKPAQPAAPAAGVTHIDFPSKQTQMFIAQLGIDRKDPDFAALSMGNQILGGGSFGTRLMSEVREKRGLTYGVYSGFTPMQVRGPFLINLQTRAELGDGTLKLVQDILRDYLKTGPTQEELDNAKREQAGSFPLSNA
ncbi:MAG: insulinase family protein, partial [Proteobacteria bacterium]